MCSFRLYEDCLFVLILSFSTCRRILDVIRMAVERKPEEKLRSALLCKVPKSYKDKTFKEKDFISDGKLSSMLKVWWSFFIFNLMSKKKDLWLYFN